MNHYFQKTIFGISLFIFCSGVLPGHAAEVLTEVPKGLQELTEFKAPVSLFVPENFQKSKGRSLLIVIPGTKVYSKEILDWQDLAKTQNLVVACPSIMVRAEDVPYKVDEWMLKLKSALATRYNTDRAYLVGLGDSAEYAAYLGLQQPEAFDAVASVGGSWTGPYEKLTQLTDDASKQTPFFVALSESDERVRATQEKAEAMTAKGYKIQVAMLNVKGEEQTDGFRSSVIRWMNEQAVKNESLRKKDQKTKKTFKQKFSKAVDEFFRV